METLANLESFVRAAQEGSFSGAGRSLGLTPAAVSRNVAALERNLGTRLFHRSTRKLTLTGPGELFLTSITANLKALQEAIANAASGSDAPAGILRVSMSPTIGMMYILPLLPAFLARYPNITPEWHFENRPVDLIGENYDAAIGGGFEVGRGLVSRRLAPGHLVAVASPGYFIGRTLPTAPSQLGLHAGIVLRSSVTGRIRQWTLRNARGEECPAALSRTIVVNDPAAMREAARLGMGVALVALPDVLPDLERGDLIRILPHWYADAGDVSLYFASRTLVAPKTRAFIDFIVSAFGQHGFAQHFSGCAQHELGAAGAPHSMRPDGPTTTP
ncbi:MAG TPA: LysR substrate-binding domain-containing protein [Telluria sp.]|jgi:DNA-binding transcriptional LysR family regulator